MQGSLLLTLLIQITVLLNVASCFLWNGANRKPPFRYNKGFMKPSEMFRHDHLKKELSRREIIHTGQDKTVPDSQKASREDRVTFEEFMKFRESLRQEAPSKTENDESNEDDEAEVTSGNLMSDRRQETRREEKTRKGSRKDFEEYLERRKEEQKMGKVQGSLDAAMGKGLSQGRESDMSKVRRHTSINPGDSRKRAATSETSSPAENPATPIDVDSSGDLQEAELQRRRTQQEGHHEEAATSESFACGSEKGPGHCSSVRYNVLAGIVSIVWFSNIVFVTWLLCGRDTKTGMKIPSGFVGKSPQKSVRQKSVPLSVEVDRGKSLSQSLPASARSKQNLKPMTKGSSDSVDEASSWPAVDASDSNVPCRGDTSATYLMPRGDHPGITTLSGLRASLVRRTPFANAQCGLPPILEAHAEGDDGLGAESSAEDWRQRGGISMARTSSDLQNINGQNLSETSMLNRKNWLIGSQSNLYNRDSRQSLPVEVPEFASNIKMHESQWDARKSCDSEDKLYVAPGLQGKKWQDELCLDAAERREANLGQSTDSLEEDSEEFQSQDASTQVSFVGVGNPASGAPQAQSTASTQCPSLCVVAKARNLQALKHVGSPARGYQRARKGHPRSTDVPDSESDCQFASRKELVQDFKGVLEYSGPDRPDSECSAKHGQKKSSSHVSEQTGNKSLRCTRKPDAACNKNDETKSRMMRSSLADYEPLMAPPPKGYHVRQDFSNPDSTLEVVRKVKIDNVGDDMSVATLITPRETPHPLKAASSGEAYDSSESGETCRHAWGKHRSHWREYLDDVIGKDKTKRSKKLVILGKLNYLNSGRGKHVTKTHCVTSRKSKKAHTQNDGDYKEERKLRGSRFRWIYPVVFKSGDNIRPEVAENAAEHPSPRSAGEPSEAACYESVDAPNCYCKVLSPSRKHLRAFHVKRHPRRHSPRQTRTGCSLKRTRLTREVTNVPEMYTSATALKAVESQPCLKSGQAVGQISPHHTSTGKLLLPLSRSQLLPSYYLNVNSNAGVPESCQESTAGGKTESKQQSCTSVHSTDQFYSTHTDAETKVMDSDLEVSPAFSFSLDGPDVGSTIKDESEPLPNVTRSSDQLKQPPESWEDRRSNFGQISNDISSQKSNKKEPASADNPVDARTENHASRSQAALTTTPKESLLTTVNKNKRKTKTTEALYIKFESSLSKKVTTTTVVKDGRRPVANKLRQDRQKPLPPPGEAQKAVTSGSERLDNRCIIDTTRFTKIIRCGEGYSEPSEPKVKHKSGYEAYLEFVASKEPQRKTRVVHCSQGQGVRSAESDHRYSPIKEVVTSSCRSEDLTHASRLVGLPEAAPMTDPSVTECHSPEFQCKKAGHLDADMFSEKGHSSAPLAELSVKSPVPQIDGDAKALESAATAKKDLGDKPEVHRKLETPKKELSNVREKNEEEEEEEQTSPAESEVLSESVVKADESQTHPEMDAQITETESPNTEKSPGINATSRRKGLPFSKAESPHIKHSPEAVVKTGIKKLVSSRGKSKSTDDARARSNGSTSSNGRSPHHSTLAAKKKSILSTKSLFRSPDGKRKKRSTKKVSESKSSSEVEDAKVEKVKKQRSSDKIVEKKKKKRKQKQKTAAGVEENSQNGRAGKKMPALMRSRSSDLSKMTQTVTATSSAPKLIDAATSETQLSPAVPCKKEKDGRSTGLRDKRAPYDEATLSLDREHVLKSRELRIKSHAASSAENISISPAPGKPVRSAESMPAFTGPVGKPAAKVVTVTTVGKVKKNEKDLQQAELGWNSSTLSAEEKAAVERVRQNQKKVMVRYYIVKPRPKKAEREVGASKLKRSAQRQAQADGDAACAAGEMDVKPDSVQPERSRTGPGKSVQFSDSIEDLEASKDEMANERALHKPESDPVLHQTAVKPISEVIKPSIKAADVEISVPSKSALQKKEESRPPATPPRRKRPVWLKKSNKEKAEATNKTNAAEKSVAGIVPLKRRQTSDNVAKPASRFNIHLYYPVKPTIGSPKLSNICLSDKRKVAYNTWISSIFLAAPLNKATKKLVAKTGSPVDIKEIIEGSSVDAADHFRAMRALHESGVRAAKSVPSLGPQRSIGVDLAGGKKLKLPEESRAFLQKKGKEKLRESLSPRSTSSLEGNEELGFGDVSVSSSSSTKVDCPPGPKQRLGHSRVNEAGFVGKKRSGKKSSQEHVPKWQIVSTQDARHVPDLSGAHYCGDVMEFNVLNMGLAWVVQSVFSRLSFLNPRQTTPTAIVSREVSSPSQQIEDKENHLKN